jgi:hypothetical protein
MNLLVVDKNLPVEGLLCVCVGCFWLTPPKEGNP